MSLSCACEIGDSLHYVCVCRMDNLIMDVLCFCNSDGHYVCGLNIMLVCGSGMCVSEYEYMPVMWMEMNICL